MMPIKIQPAIKNKPPIGVIGPSSFSQSALNKFRVHKTYNEPEKSMIPIKKE